MAFPKVLLLGILLLGASVATVIAVGPVEGETVDATPITVPTSRVGDRVVYEVYVVPVDPASPGTDPSPPVLVEVHEFVLEELGKRLDWFGRVRSVVQVHHVITTIQPSSSIDGSPASFRQAVDRSERYAVETHIITDGWGFGMNISMLRPSDPGIPGVSIQGNTLKLGDTVAFPDAAAPLGMPWGGRGSASPVLSTPTWQIPSWREVFMALDAPRSPEAFLLQAQPPGVVAAAGTVASVPVLAVDRIRQDVDVFQGPAAQTLPSRPSSSGASSTAASTAAALVHERSWFSADAPYPLLIETQSVDPTASSAPAEGKTTTWLAEFTPGQGALVWSPATLPEPGVLERSGAQHYPAEGTPFNRTRATLAYPLAQALNDVATFPPGGFLVWRSSNPGYVLVAATLTPGSHERPGVPSHEWRLSFAAPQGDSAYTVLVERVNGVPLPYVEGMGEQAAVAFNTTDLPTDLLTWEAAAGFWRAMMAGPDGPRFAHWGLTGLDRSTSTSCGGTFTAGGETSASVADQFASIQIGGTQIGPCLSSNDRPLMAGVLVDGEHGVMLGQFNLIFDWEPEPWLGRAASGPGSVHLSGAGESYEAAVLVAGVASTSLLIAALAAYFMPHLKWIATQAIFVFPGFTKLRREKLLDHALRDELNGTIQAEPGIHPSELRRRTGAGWGTVVHHLTMMEKSGLVVSVIDGRYRRYFPASPGGAAALRPRAVLTNDNTRRVLTLVEQDPGVHTSEIAARVGMSTAGAMWHLSRLAEVGLVAKQKHGRAARFFPCDDPATPPPYDPKTAVEVA